MAEMTKPAAQPRAKRGEGPRTDYVILRLDSTDRRIGKVVDDIAASSALAAVRGAYAQRGQEGLYVAVPKRSWRPIEVKVERTERLIVEPYKASKQGTKPEPETEKLDIDPLRPIEPEVTKA